MLKRRHGFESPRTTVLGAVTAWLLVSVSVFAAEPALVVSIKSFNELLTDSLYLGNAVNQPLLGAALPGLITQITGGKGLKGLDSTKPIGAYVTLPTSGGPPEVVVFLPVTSQKTFADTLAAILPGSSTENGLTLYQSANLPMPIFAKQGAKHFLLSQSAEALANTHDPAKLVKSTSDIAMEFDLTKFSDEQKQQFLAQAEAGAQRAGQNSTPENEAERLGREAGEKMAMAGLSRVVMEGERLHFGINVDAKAKSISVDMGFTSKPKTSLATACSNYALNGSPFASLITKQTLGSLLISTPLSEDAQALFKLAMDQAEKEAAAKAGNDADREGAKQILEKMRQVLSLDRLDHAYIVNTTSSGKLQFVMAAKIAKGKDLQQLIDDLIRKSPDSKVQKGVATVRGVRIDSAPLPPDPDYEKNFGSEPAHFAISNDLTVLSFGADSLAAVKACLDLKSGKATRAPVSLRIGLSKLLPLVPNADPQLLELSKTVFASGNDEVAIEVVGQITGASLRFEIQEGVLKLIGLVGAAKAQGN